MPEPTDHDPFSSFAHFDPEVPMHLSAAAIRRRGDRLRRRNTGLAIAGGVAVIALIATPLAVLAGGDDQALDPANPAPTVTGPAPVDPTVTDPADPETAPLVTSIPDDFPLAAGYPDTNEDLTPVAVDDDANTGDFALCFGAGFSPDTSKLTDLAFVEFDAPEDSRDRMLSVWQDEPSAAAALRTVRDVLAACAPDGLVYTERESSYDTDSAVFTAQAGRGDNPSALGLDVYEAVQVRNALYLSHDYGEGGPDDAAAVAGVERSAEESATVMSAVDAVFGVPDDDAEPTGEQTEAPASDDLSDFPLALDWPDPADVEGPEFGLEGPGTDVYITYVACSRSPRIRDTTGDLRARYSNVEDTRTRELLTFADAQDAVDFMTRTKTFYADCPEDTNPDEDAVYPHEVVDTEVGGQSFAVINSTEIGGEPAPGLEVLQFIRLGRSVLIDTTYGEGIRRDAAGTLDRMTLATAGVLAEMCTFTEAGC